MWPREKKMNRESHRSTQKGYKTLIERCVHLCPSVFQFFTPTCKGEVMDPVILDLRNRALAKRIQDWPGERIFITYGAAHIPGTLAELRKLDPAWEIKSLKWTRAISAPEHVQGELIDAEARGRPGAER